MNSNHSRRCHDNKFLIGKWYVIDELHNYNIYKILALLLLKEVGNARLGESD